MGAIIELRDAICGYGKLDVLRKCSLVILERSVTALLGRNGAGKTTIFRCLMNGLPLRSGEILIEGRPVGSLTPQERSRKISHVAQVNQVVFQDVLAREYIVEGRTPYLKGFSMPGRKDYELAERYAEETGCARFLDKRLSQISGGELQLVLVARALAQETPILLMDEPMSALDLNNQARILSLILRMQQDGKTVLFSTHDPNHAALLDCDACILDAGAIVKAGAASEIINRETMSQIYGSCVSVLKFGDRKLCVPVPSRDG